MAELMYPYDLLSDTRYGGHCIKFTLIDYNRNNIAVTSNPVNNTSNNNPNDSALFGRSGQSPTTATANASSQPASASSSSEYYVLYTEKVSGNITLYMPPNIKATTESKWNTTQMGITGALINTDAGREFINSTLGSGSIQSFADALKSSNITGMLKEEIENTLAQKLGQSAASSGLPNVYDQYMKSNRTVINPHVELLFDGVGMRTFMFQYRFMPRNETECKSVVDIIKSFRYHMAPEITDSIGGNSSGSRIWKIFFISG